MLGLRDGNLWACCLTAVALIAGCSAPLGTDAPAASADPAVSEQIVVGSFDFPESVLLANVYASALVAAGFPATVQPNVGTRELVDAALMDGLVQIVPEYAGSALDFLSLGRVTPTSDQARTHADLAESAEERGLVAAAAAEGQNNNAVVVTAAMAAHHHLRTIDDLSEIASTLVLGGPPECPQRRYCLAGLESVYGLHFKSFVPTDAGGPLTRQALSSGHIDVGLLFTTDPRIAAHKLVILADDRGLQPAENITPLIRQETVTKYGETLVKTLDAVSATLSTNALVTLNGRVEDEGLDARTVAEDWIRVRGLAPSRQSVS